MKKLLLNRKPIRNQSWGGGNLFVCAMCDMAASFGFEIVFDFGANPDVILMLDPRPGNTGIEGHSCKIEEFRKRMKIPVIHRVNECGKRKDPFWQTRKYRDPDFMDFCLLQCSQWVDMTIFVSEWMRDYHFSNLGYDKDEKFLADGIVHFNGQGASGNFRFGFFPGIPFGGNRPEWKHDVIYNGVEKKHFYPNSVELKSEKVKIVAHHWSDNMMKGRDVYEAIDNFVGQHPEFEFTYIGRHQCNFKNTHVISPKFGWELGEELRKHDVYISGSRFDPGPNHITESISCGLPTYVHIDGGGCKEFAGRSHTYDSWKSLEAILLGRKFERNQVEFSTWEEMCAKYYQMIDRVLVRQAA